VGLEVPEENFVVRFTTVLNMELQIGYQISLCQNQRLIQLRGIIKNSHIKRQQNVIAVNI